MPFNRYFISSAETDPSPGGNQFSKVKSNTYFRQFRMSISMVMQGSLKLSLRLALILNQYNIFTPVCHSFRGGGGYLADTTLWADIPLGRNPQADTPPRCGHCSGRYASYWNAFWFHIRSLSSRDNGYARNIFANKLFLLQTICDFHGRIWND